MRRRSCTATSPPHKRRARARPTPSSPRSFSHACPRSWSQPGSEGGDDNGDESSSRVVGAFWDGAHRPAGTGDGAARLLPLEPAARAGRRPRAHVLLRRQGAVLDQVFDPKVYAEWTTKLKEADTKITAIISTKESLAGLESELSAQVAQLSDLIAERASKRSAFLQNMLEGNEHVQVVVSPLGQDPATLTESLRDLLAVERFEDSFKTLVEPIVLIHREGGATDDGSGLASAIDTMKRRLIRWAIDADSSAEDGIDRRLMTALAKKQQQDGGFAARIAAWYPEDGVLVKYGTESGFRRLSEGSLGQKAAAILAFILSYGSDPLVIDQPEEDLDNALITDLIVTGVRKGKLRRQIIVITHNSNIVVNGDVELVHALKMERGQVKVDSTGSLTDSNVRTSICTIMEGGRDALRQRFQRLIVQNEVPEPQA